MCVPILKVCVRVRICDKIKGVRRVGKILLLGYGATASILLTGDARGTCPPISSIEHLARIGGSCWTQLVGKANGALPFRLSPSGKGIPTEGGNISSSKGLDSSWGNLASLFLKENDSLVETTDLDFDIFVARKIAMRALVLMESALPSPSLSSSKVMTWLIIFFCSLLDHNRYR